jgi:hypothetical protein
MNTNSDLRTITTPSRKAQYIVVGLVRQAHALDELLVLQANLVDEHCVDDDALLERDR